MQEILTVIKDRHSTRVFNPGCIEKEVIKELIDCARLAPTARNVQPWEFIVVSQKDILREIALLAETGKFIADSACCIAVFCRNTKYYLEDGCAATENILIAAAGLGIDSCWVAGDKKPYCDKISELLGVPSGDFKLISLIALGYSEKRSQMPIKRPLREVLHWQKFNNRELD